MRTIQSGSVAALLRFGLIPVVLFVLYVSLAYHEEEQRFDAWSENDLAFEADKTTSFSFETTTEMDMRTEADFYYRPPVPRPNVLFLMTDDMRAQLGCYQDEESSLAKPALHTPNLDKLASRSLLLKRAYVQFSLCGPSRTSILTSRRPDTTRIFDNNNYWREFGGNFTTIPQYFKQNGYHTVGIGKIFHRDVSSNENDPVSWSIPYMMPKHSEGAYLKDGEAGWKPVTRREREHVELMDTEAVNIAGRVLEDLAPKAKTGERPFFMALGFKKPHSSYVCPKEFFDMYPLESETQFLADTSWQTVSFDNERHLKNVTITSEGNAQLPPETLREIRRAYFACVSYVDHLVGEVLHKLKHLGLADSTIVSFVSDHGYQFGENGGYGKLSLLETATRVPLMVHIPGITDKGIVSKSVSETLDLFPTLVEAAGLPHLRTCPRSSADVELCTQGKSFLPLVYHPTKPIKTEAFSQIAASLGFMRYAIRTSRFRYTEWCRVQRDTSADGVYEIKETNPKGFEVELYDHKYDRDESHNVAQKEKYARILHKLSRKLHVMISRKS